MKVAKASPVLAQSFECSECKCSFKLTKADLRKVRYYRPSDRYDEINEGPYVPCPECGNRVDVPYTLYEMGKVQQIKARSRM